MTTSVQWWLNRAVQAAKQISDPKERLEFWGSLAQVAIRMGHDSQYQEIARLMLADAPDEQATLETHVRLAEALTRAHRWEAARKAAERIEDSNRRRRVQIGIAVEQVKQGEFEQAKALVSSMPERWRARGYRELARARASDDLPGALALIRSIPSGQGRRADLPHLLRVAIQRKDAEGVKNVLATALEEGEHEGDPVRPAHYYLSIASPLKAAPQELVGPDSRRRLLEGMHELTGRTADFRAREYLTRALLAMGEFEEAESIIAKVEPDDARAGLEGSLALALAGKGRLNEALAIADSGRLNRGAARVNRVTDQVYSEVAATEMRAGSLTRAEAIAEKISPRYSGRDGLFQSLAESRVKVGDIDAARSLVARISKGWMKVEVHVATAERLAQESGADAASGDLDQAQQIAETIEDGSTRSQALQRIAIARLRLDDVAGAVDTARRIPSARWRCSALLTIAKHRPQAGARDDSEEYLRLAAQAASEITDGTEGEPACRYATIALTYWTAGRPDRFRETMALAVEAAQQAEGPFWEYAAYGAIAAAHRKADRMAEFAAAIDGIEPALDRAVAYSTALVILRPDLRE